MEEDPLDTLLQALSTSPSDRWVVLPGVGWLSVKQYKAYERNPRTDPAVSVPVKRLPFFTSDPELDRALAGLAPSGITFADERTRYLRAIRPDGNKDEDDDDPATVIRTPGAEAIADKIRGRLLAGEAADVPGLGVFDIIEKPSRPGANPETGEPIIVPAYRLVRFRVAEELKARLNSSPHSA